MSKRFAVILAAGAGTRMKSKLYKVLHPIAGRPMLQHVIDGLKPLQLDLMTTVVGFEAEKVIEQIGDQSEFVIQEKQLGTGHAVLQAEELLGSAEGTTMVVCGDTPLITKETYQALFDFHEQQHSKATILTAKAPNPTGYGRIIRNAHGEVERIVEHKDASEEELSVAEINTGTYCFDNKSLFQALKKVSNDNAQGEYYLTDVIEIIKNDGDKVSAYQTEEFEETLGINDRKALAEAERIMNKRILWYHMENGVTIMNPDNTYIGADVTIESDVTIYPGVVLTGESYIRSDTVIGAHSEIDNCQIGESVSIKQSVLINSRIGDGAEIGPFAYIRPETSTGENVKVGPFVEVKKTKIGDNSKIPHLSYVGDANVGKNVNIGCGSITVNYDGHEKHQTDIEDDSFIGCNTNLVAPVKVGKGSFVAAGSTITKDVPKESFAIARARQTNKEGYASKFKHKKNH